MNTEVKNAFSRLKPVCDVLMVCPIKENIDKFILKVSELKKEVAQELQQYLLFPFITHLSSEELSTKFLILEKMAETVKVVLEKIIFVNSYEMCMKIETALLSLVFENSRPGMNPSLFYDYDDLFNEKLYDLTSLISKDLILKLFIIADVSETMKLNVMAALTQLMLKINTKFRMRFLKTQLPLIAQAVFVSVHIAKLEKSRPLRLQALKCVTAHTAVHQCLLVKGQTQDAELEKLIVEMLTNILPGVLAALQDVATCPNYPGHVVICEAIYAIHRMLYVTMNDKHLSKKVDVTAADFANMIIEKAKEKKETIYVSSTKQEEFAKRTSKWFTMAGEKLTVITQSLVVLRTHDHYKVRKELAVYCRVVLADCNSTMQQSVPLALEILMSLSEDEYPEVAEYCRKTVKRYLDKASDDSKDKTLDSVCENFFAALHNLPGVLNNIDGRRKLSSLNIIYGYIRILCEGLRGQRLSTAISPQHRMRMLCNTLIEAVSVYTDLTLLTRTADRDMAAALPTGTPWCKLRHLDTAQCEKRFQDICQLLGDAECSELILDSLLETFMEQYESEVAYIMNWMGCSPKSPKSLVKRILNTYLEENIWYQPLELGSSESPITADETLDVSVYNPRAWTKESVPDLYEGTVETRYTGISYLTPRKTPQRDPSKCATLAEAQKNMVLLCVMTDGVGMMARKLGTDYQPFLLKSLCPILERVGSQYEMLHLAGVKALNDVAAACGHSSPTELIKHNADYCTNQITVRLKKAWNCQSALQILSVVMEYSNSSILDYLHGITKDVLVQSCDKYYEKDLNAYLQVFLTFVDCIRKWFPPVETSLNTQENIDLLNDLMEHIRNEEETERLLKKENNESGKSAEEMFSEDQKIEEDEVLNYDDTVTREKEILPQHVLIVISIIKRCLHFVTTKHRDNSILALQVLNRGLPILRDYEDELLPLVHKCWAPLVVKLKSGEAPVMRRAFELFVTLAELAKDFIRSRAVKEVLSDIYKFMHKSAKDSYLKDTGSAYRNSQAYMLQLTALNSLPRLAVDLMLDDEALDECMDCVGAYLSNKQPKPLQASALEFFKKIREYNYGAAFHHLRMLCDNNEELSPPNVKYRKLETIRGTPFMPNNKDYECNIKLIFNLTVL